MQRKIHLIQASSLIIASAMLFGCAARYHTVHKPEGAEASDNKLSEGGSTEDAIPTTGQPSAGIEAIVDGQVVSAVPVGQTVTIRPTVDTLDPEDAGLKDCRNPGIVSATFSVQQTSDITVSRNGSDCKALEITRKFSSAGTYIIQLKVKTAENETATAQATLVVFDSEADTLSPNGQAIVHGGFVITASPLATKPDVGVNFSADCRDNNDVHISWDFGDGEQATGQTTAHAFSQAGQYIVKATCTKDGEDPLTSQVTIAVTKPASSNSTAKDSTGSKDGSSAGDYDTNSDDGSDGKDSSSNTGSTGGSSSSSNSSSDTGSNSSSNGSNSGSGTNNNTSWDDDSDNKGTGSGTTPGQNNPSQNPSQK